MVEMTLQKPTDEDPDKITVYLNTPTKTLGNKSAFLTPPLKI